MAEWQEWWNGRNGIWNGGMTDGMAEWQNGRMAEWQNGRMAEWREWRMEWSNDRMAEQQEWRTEWSNGGNGRMAGMADGVKCGMARMVEWLNGGRMAETMSTLCEAIGVIIVAHSSSSHSYQIIVGG